ncbi:MAG: NADH-quinone oxidoreductase subunit C [Bacteroidia bacterium]|nr:NADH-quinone oxidoreductase subunit C [Bacteroidia bacterium]
MKFLRDEPKLYFDFLNCLSGVDLGNERLEVVYHLTSIPRGHTLVVKQKTSEPLSTEIRSKEFPSKIYAESLPTIPSISHLWKAALWHEREAFDLLGIHFVGHPDLRRILLPDDWQGHPLRKDYQVQETYHNIPVPYPPDREPPIIIE